MVKSITSHTFSSSDKSSDRSFFSLRTSRSNKSFNTARVDGSESLVEILSDVGDKLRLKEGDLVVGVTKARFGKTTKAVAHLAAIAVRISLDAIATRVLLLKATIANDQEIYESIYRYVGLLMPATQDPKSSMRHNHISFE
mmetsp:Transcript_6960/g.10149  ORF Transcript_6960/g.10149 Transcript_6960/m.10149 type:complete len:141 (-) Transcript_6960:8-430(-)